MSFHFLGRGGGRSICCIRFTSGATPADILMALLFANFPHVSSKGEVPGII